MEERFVCIECNALVDSARRGACGRSGHVPVRLTQAFSASRWVAVLTAAWLVIVACLVWFGRAAYLGAAKYGGVSEARRAGLVAGMAATLLLLLMTGSIRWQQWNLLHRLSRMEGPAAELVPILTQYMASFKRATSLAWTLIVVLFLVWYSQLGAFVGLFRDLSPLR